MLGLQGRHFSVMTALDLLAENEGDTAGAVIGSRAIVADTTAELREHQQDHVIGVVVFAQVLHERVDTLGYRAPQIAVAGVLAGMCVESAVIAVEDAAAQISEVSLRDA